ncbi:hypothetical protein INT48_009038 [Thamnidium elegans]|uniref:DUF3020 domain-containing protein n=1 Tax=Thamnidium elegans TaxID=101142 RepID=A0A8H7VXU6_9FUNG|nr:hypothetical protein INT48_009038 [Thamnidium elegans]
MDQATREPSVDETVITLASIKNDPETEPVQVTEPMDIDTNETDTSNTMADQQQQNEQERQHLQDLEAISQLQQMSAAQTQALASAAAAALSNSSNFHLFANFDSNAALAASVIAAAANANNGNSNSSPKILKRELMNQKVRADNRERKKRWRQQNEERNKDNDLRCRVNKRAHKLFGKEDSEHKKKWIDEEFLKRQQKRKDKERRKGLVDDSLGGHHANLVAAAAANSSSNTSNNNGNIDMLNHQITPGQPIQGLTDANYLTLLCNNLGIPAAARSLIGSAHGTGNSINNTENTNPEDGDSNEAKDNKRMAREENMDEDKQSTSVTDGSSTNTTEGTDQQQQQQTNAEFPMDAVLTLMQLNAGWRQ